MFARLGVWISACVFVVTFAGSAEAVVRKTNRLSNVATHIVPNFDRAGADVCFVHNANNASVSILVSVFPTGTLVLAADTWTSTIVLGPFATARVFSWTPLLPASEYCKVMTVR
jgi:hypothetical protein